MTVHCWWNEKCLLHKYLEGSPLRVFARIEGKPWNELQDQRPVKVEPFDVPDGRIFYRFRVSSAGGPVGPPAGRWGLGAESVGFPVAFSAVQRTIYI